MAVLFVFCMGYWFILVRYVYPKHPNWDYAGTLNRPPQDQSSTTQPSTAPGGEAATSAPSMTAASSPSLLVASTQPAGAGATKVLGSEKPNDPNYGLGLQLDPRGAGLDSVTINSYKDADAKGLYVFQKPNPDEEDQLALATQSVVIDGQSADLNSADWRLEPGSTNTTATFGLDVMGPTHVPLLHISKTYQLQARGPSSNRDNTAAGYEITVTYHLKNATRHPLKDVQVEFNGPTMPPRELERSDDRQIVSGYDKGDQVVDVSRDTLSEFKPASAQKDLSVYKGYKFLWSGMSSNYFAAIVLGQTKGEIGKVEVRCSNPDAESDQRKVRLDFQTAPVSLAGGSSADLPLKVFFGPKIRDLMEGDFYGEFPRGYNQLLTTSGSMCALCAPQWLVDRLVDLLRIFHFVLRDWGLAIIALVLLVRAVLHPISKYSQVSMLKLQKMGPELERLKKKHADDKEALAKAQMEMHKEMGITPFLGCLPMFLQTPIWIALYSALENDIALRQAPFLWKLTWIHDLSQPDRLITWSHPFTVPILGMKVASLNILPLFVAVLMFLQQKFTPQAPTMNPEQESQQKMMRYMSLAFSLFFYWMPSGLNLYILTSSAVAIFESKIIREHIKQREERDKANKVIVDVKPTRQGKQNKKQEPPRESKSGCLGGFWANLQQKAEDIRREAEKKGKR
jgi:YidC/Oxa1 family membrane protein insertase